MNQKKIRAEFPNGTLYHNFEKHNGLLQFSNASRSLEKLSYKLQQIWGSKDDVGMCQRKWDEKTGEEC